MKDFLSKLKNRVKDQRQFIGFAAIGIINSALSMGTYVLLVLLGLHYLLANALAYAVGIACSYLLNTRFVFKTAATKEKGVKFTAVYLLGFLLSSLLLKIFIDGLGVDKIIAQFFAAALVLFVNYALQKLWTFRKE